MNNLNNAIKATNDNNEENSNIAGISSIIENFNKVLNPIIEAQKLWFNNINIKNPLSDLNIDFSNIEKNTRIGCEKMIASGFYPYSKIGTSTCLSIIKLKDPNEIEKILGDNVEYFLKYFENNMINTFNDYSDIIKEIFELYDKKNYRLCILSLINVLSQIFNNSFEYKDFTEVNEVTLRNYRVMNFSNEEYYKFMPYCIKVENKKTSKKYINTLLVNCQNHNEQYKDIPYNRNAILHGYSKNFGNKINCLRWFSVLFNTNDIFEKSMLKGENDNEIKI